MDVLQSVWSWGYRQTLLSAGRFMADQNFPLWGNISEKSQRCCSKKKGIYHRSTTVCFPISGKQMIDEEARRRKSGRKKKSWNTKISQSSGSAGAQTGSAWLPAQFAGSRTGTRNACLTHWRGQAICGANLSYRHIMSSHDGSAEGQEFTRARLGRGHSLQSRSCGKQDTAASHPPLPQPRECAHG